MKRQLSSHSSICAAQCIPQALPCLGLFHCRQISRWQSLGQQFSTLHEKDKQHLQEPNPHAGDYGLQAGRESRAPWKAPRRDPLPCRSALHLQREQRKPFAEHEKKEFCRFGSTNLHRHYLLTICTDAGISGERHCVHFLLVAFPPCLVRPEPFNVSCKSSVITREHIEQVKIYFFVVLELFVCFNPFFSMETSIHAWIPTCFLVGLRPYCFWMSQTLLLLLLLLLPFLFLIFNLNDYLFGLLDVPHP